MVTILHRQRYGYDVRIYPDDHDPPHAHIWKGGRQVKIDLETMEVILATYNFNSWEIRQIVKLLREHERRLFSVWEQLQDS